jgi:hypothetical protein
MRATTWMVTTKPLQQGQWSQLKDSNNAIADQGKQRHCYKGHNASLGWEIHSEFHGIPRLFRFRTFWTLEFSSEFYFSDRKMCCRQF